MKIVICSTDVYSDLDVNKKEEFRCLIDRLVVRGDVFVFTAKSESKKDVLIDINFSDKIKFISRDKLRSKIKSCIEKYKENFFVIVGNREADLFMAASNKVFYVQPGWCNSYDKVVLKYGIATKTIKALELLINIVENQANWYYKIDVDDKTTVLALTNANTYGKHSLKEREMIDHFRDVLKEGKKEMQSVLLVHFLAAVSNNIEFREIKDWAIMPSSGIELNKDMLLFKEKARELMNGRKKEAVFIRHTPTLKSHESYKNGVNRLPCDRHFDSIILNPIYKGKLKGRTICVFDDYSTNGTTFEVARNILLKEGVKRIFFVSLGKFGHKHVRQEYTLDGDVSLAGYKYSKTQEIMLDDGTINESAIIEIENLHDILYN